ncbi:CD48 antigen-like [Mixophyes fleayi]|uniref:CD48 antigen-like n=1 Tax=Mixophyes fleayi TaxID=3061075 RepID=UPI003F4DE8E3
MSNTWDKTRSVQSVSWKFNRNGKLIIILDTSIQPYYIYPSQFSERLEVSHNVMTVTIKDLRKEDGGMFYSELIYKDGETDTFTYNVTIYEPVPAPAIRIEGVKRTSDWCNDTLHCSVPTNTSVLSYTWKYRHRDTEYQPYNNTGSIIQMSLWPEYWDMELLCIVHNPADQKNVSVRVREECPLSGKPRTKAQSAQTARGRQEEWPVEGLGTAEQGLTKAQKEEWSTQSQNEETGLSEAQEEGPQEAQGTVSAVPVGEELGPTDRRHRQTGYLNCLRQDVRGLQTELDRITQHLDLMEDTI